MTVKELIIKDNGMILGEIDYSPAHLTFLCWKYKNYSDLYYCHNQDRETIPIMDLREAISGRYLYAEHRTQLLAWGKRFQSKLYTKLVSTDV